MHTIDCVVVAMLLAAVLTEGYTPPDMFWMRHRGGAAYAQTVAEHERLHRQHFGHSTRNSTVNYFSQLIDHDDPKRGTFRQRWFIDYTYWSQSNSTRQLAFFYVAGEAPQAHTPGGYITVVAREMGALVVTMEHRYYGESLPAPLTDKDTLRTLSVGSALADINAFLKYLESPAVLGRPLTWVVVGGSYAGAMSAWNKVAFPDFYVASWSSSGVVHPIFDFTSYDGHVASVLPQECLDSVRNVLGNFSIQWDNPEGQQTIRATFGIPNYFTKADVAWMLADASAASVQYGMKGHMCSELVPQSNDLFHQYATYINTTWGTGFSSNCGYSTKCLSDPSMQDQWPGADYAWVYHTCSQLGWWQIGYPGSPRSPLTSSEYFINQCREAFWPDIYPDVWAFNDEYGGTHPNASHVIALQGSDDPWSTAGVLGNLSDTYLEFTAVCDGCGHCGDLAYPGPNTNPSIQAQQQFIWSVLSDWVNATNERPTQRRRSVLRNAESRRR